MKLLVFAIFFFVVINAHAQNSDCPPPVYFSTLTSLLNKQVSDIFLTLSNTDLKYIKSYQGEYKEFVVDFDDGKQQFSFVFIANIAKLIIVSGNHCACLGELASVNRFWQQQQKPTYYRDSGNTAELRIIVDDDGGCMTIKALR